MGVKIRHFVIEREGPVRSAGDHAHEPTAVKTDRVGVLGVEFVDEPFLGIVRVLRDFFDKRFVVKPVNGFEFGWLAGDLKRQRWSGVHKPEPLSVCIEFSFRERAAKIPAISWRMFLWCASRTMPASDESAATSLMPKADGNRRTASDEREPREGEVAQQRKAHEETRTRSSALKGSARGSRRGSRDAFAALKAKLRRPRVPDDHSGHGHHGDFGRDAEFRGKPNRSAPLVKSRRRNDEARPAEDAADVARADAAGAELANVLAVRQRTQ